jgi:hypothetical protein
MPDVFAPAADCPFNYDVTLPGQTSRYRLIAVERRVPDHADDCADDQPGTTHVVAFDDDEVGAVQAFLNQRNDVFRLWLGGVQLREQTTTRIGWLAFTGGEMADPWGPNEPNDGGAGIENSQENFVGIERNRQGLVDFPLVFTGGVLCECDGRRVDPAAAAAIEAMRM